MVINNQVKALAVQPVQQGIEATADKSATDGHVAAIGQPCVKPALIGIDRHSRQRGGRHVVQGTELLDDEFLWPTTREHQQFGHDVVARRLTDGDERDPR